MVRKSHTITLVQFTPSDQTKLYIDHDTITAAMLNIRAVFRSKVMSANPQNVEGLFTEQELFDFIDSLPDIAVLVYDHQTSTYKPHGKSWIKFVIQRITRRQLSREERMQKKLLASSQANAEGAPNTAEVAE